MKKLLIGYTANKHMEFLDFAIVIALIASPTEEEHIVRAEYMFHFPQFLRSLLSKLEGS
jgi:hypothetical protein